MRRRRDLRHIDARARERFRDERYSMISRTARRFSFAEAALMTGNPLLADFVAARNAATFEKVLRGGDHSGRAITALHRAVFDEPLVLLARQWAVE